METDKNQIIMLKSLAFIYQDVDGNLLTMVRVNTYSPRVLFIWWRQGI